MKRWKRSKSHIFQIWNDKTHFMNKSLLEWLWFAVFLGYWIHAHSYFILRWLNRNYFGDLETFLSDFCLRCQWTYMQKPGHILPKTEMFPCSAVKANNIWIINLVPVSDWQEIKEMVISFPTQCHSFPWLTQVAKNELLFWQRTTLPESAAECDPSQTIMHRRKQKSAIMMIISHHLHRKICLKFLNCITTANVLLGWILSMFLLPFPMNWW